MLLLTSTSDLLQIVTSASADIEVHASWLDNNAGAITPGRTNTASITTATTTTIVASPAASTQRNVVHLNIRNNHATASSRVTITHTDGTNVETLMSVILVAGETLVMDDIGRWLHYNSDGVLYPELGAIATQTEVETGTSTSTIMTPANYTYHKSTAGCWVKFGTTGNVLASWNVTSVTDNAVGRATVNLTTAFSSANWVCASAVERASTTLTVANLRYTRIESAGQAAGSIVLECFDGTATTALLADPTSWHVVGFGDL